MESDRGDWDTADPAMDHCAGDDLYTQAGHAYGAFVFWVERRLPLNALQKMGICSVSWDLHFGATFAGVASVHLGLSPMTSRNQFGPYL